MKYEAIRACSREFSVVKMCKALGLRTSNYYRWKKNQEKKEKKEREDRELAAKVREVFIRNKRLYGYRKMKGALEKEGIVLSEYKVRQIMRRTGLYPVSMRKYRPGRCRSVGEPYAALRLYSGLPMLPERKIPQAYPWTGEFKAQAAGAYRSCEGDSFEVMLRDDGTLFTLEDREEKDIIPVSTRIAVIPGKFSDAKVKFYTRQGKVFAVLRGSRILPKE